jgi:hypothetical protein
MNRASISIGSFGRRSSKITDKRSNDMPMESCGDCMLESKTITLETSLLLFAPLCSISFVVNHGRLEGRPLEGRGDREGRTVEEG